LKKQFESPPYSVSVEAGQGMQLRCLPPIGLPSPRVYWMRNGVNLGAESTDTLLVSSEGHLLVGQANLDHQANYTCVAENIAAKRLSEPARITVYGKSAKRQPLPAPTIVTGGVGARRFT
jgi:netrin receptor unc-5